MQIATLLTLYWTADESPKTRALIADAWLEDLEEFDPDAVADACREWRRTQSKRPSIVELRTLCIEAQANRTLRLTQRKELTADELDAAADNWAQSHGWASIADAQRDPHFRGAWVSIGRQRRRYELIVDVEPISVAPLTKPVTPERASKKPLPAWIVERDRQRAEGQRQALGLDRLDAAIERMLAGEDKRPEPGGFAEAAK